MKTQDQQDYEACGTYNTADPACRDATIRTTGKCDNLGDVFRAHCILAERIGPGAVASDARLAMQELSGK